MDTLNNPGIIDFVQFRRKKMQNTSRSKTMSRNQLESLITTIRQLLQKARSTDDSCEYYRLCEELRLAQAALDARSAPTVSPALALV